MGHGKFKIIGFDADDTLWVNETYYRDTEKKFCELMSPYCSRKQASEELYRMEVGNLGLYGYGAKGFILSMMEAALGIGGEKISGGILSDIIDMGKAQIERPLILLNGVEKTLKSLFDRGAKLILATKGDLLDQERKLALSGIDKYFHHIEIMSDKKEANYSKLLSRLDIEGGDFLMVGNSMKSDILPVLALGGWAVHVPYHTTWQHEIVGTGPESPRFRETDSIEEVINILDNWEKEANL